MTPTLTDLQRQIAKADQIEKDIESQIELLNHQLGTLRDAREIAKQRLADARARENEFNRGATP